MSYHYTTTSTAARQSTTNAQGQSAPPGYHYMPDGSLMSDADHNELYGGKIITNFDLDTSNIKAGGERRSFTISGNKGAVFSLEIRNEDDAYYNFTTNLFQTSQAKLNNITITDANYTASVRFPKVADADQYNFYLFTENGTKHAQYKEVRFPDNSIDINSTTGSNSNLIQKVIYQTLDVTLTLSGYSPSETVTGTFGSQIITTSRNANIGTIPFSFTVTTGTSNALKINKQPAISDIMTFVRATVDATPLTIEGEDIYPAVTDTDVVDGDFGAGTTNKIVMDNNVASKMVVGDRITTAVTTDTIDGDVELIANFDEIKVVMDNNVATKMAVGDRVTITAGATERKVVEYFNNNVIVVGALNPDTDNVKEFSLANELSGPVVNELMELKDGSTLTFSSKLNREIFTVAVLNPDTDNTKEFSMFNAGGGPGNVGIRDNATLSFSNQRNHRWAFDNIHKLSTGMRQLKSTYFTTQPVIQEYLTQTTINEGQVNEYKIDNVRVPGLDSLSALPVTTRNATTNVETTVQTGNVTFSEQALLTFGGGTNATIFSYGQSAINKLTGYNVEFSDLAIELAPILTTTTAASSNSASVAIADRIGIANLVSKVSGIGINPTISGSDTVDGAISGASKIVMDKNVALSMTPGDIVTGTGIPLTSTVTVVALDPDGDNAKEFSVSENITVGDGIRLSFSNQIDPSPFVNSGAGTVTGAGTIVLSTLQTLEDGVTLTFSGAGSVATITGNIKVNKVGNENVVLRFDLDRLLTML